MAAQPDEEYAFVVDGTEYTGDDLTFREQRQLRDWVREIEDDPDLEMEDAPQRAFYPALLTVIKRRDNPAYSVETALDLKLGDLVVPRAKGKAGARPTQGKS